jgi:hypothetical protein
MIVATSDYAVLRPTPDTKIALDTSCTTTNLISHPAATPQLNISRPSQTRSPFTEFHFFPLLPTEIRLQIWTYTLPGTRTIELHRYPSTNSITSTAIIPITLSITHESRTLALSHYTLSFSLLPTTLNPKPQPKVYFRPEKDILLYNARYDCACCPPGGADDDWIFRLEDWKKVRNVALVSKDLCVNERVYDEFIRRLDSNENVEGSTGWKGQEFKVEYWPLYPRLMRSVLMEWERRGSGRWIEFEREDWEWQMKELEKKFGQRIELGVI